MRKAQHTTGRKEAVKLIHKAANLKTKFDSYEMMKKERKTPSQKIVLT